MTVGVIRMELRVPDSHSLKDKRRVLRSLKDRLANTFNASVAEVDNQDVWQSAVLGVAIVGNESRFVQTCLDRVVEWMRRQHTVLLVNYAVDTV